MTYFCPHPEKCREEAKWIHNPHTGWSYLQASISQGRQPVCYAFPEHTLSWFSGNIWDNQDVEKYAVNIDNSHNIKIENCTFFNAKEYIADNGLRVQLLTIFYSLEDLKNKLAKVNEQVDEYHCTMTPTMIYGENPFKYGRIVQKGGRIRKAITIMEENK